VQHLTTAAVARSLGDGDVMVVVVVVVMVVVVVAATLHTT